MVKTPSHKHPTWCLRHGIQYNCIEIENDVHYIDVCKFMMYCFGRKAYRLQKKKKILFWSIY